MNWQKARPVVAAVVVTAALALLVAPTVTVHTQVRHEAFSRDAGVTYPYAGTHAGSELRHVRVHRLTGTSNQLLVGSDAHEVQHTVELHLGPSGVRVEAVEWHERFVTVRFFSGHVVTIPAREFSSLQ